MKSFKISLEKICFYAKFRIHLLIFLFSLTSIVLVFFNLINLNVILGISEIFFLEFFFRLAVVFSTIIVILFLPTYPILFIIFKEKNYNLLEKLGLTIVINLVFYILIGYVGFYIGFGTTGVFFFFALIISFISIISCVFFCEFKKGINIFLIPSKNSIKDQEFNKEFSLVKYFKNLIPLNGLLLIIFMILFCIYNIVRFSYFFGTDGWYHVFIIEKIINLKYLPLNEYYGSMGFHIFGAVIQFFSGVDIIAIPRYFVFYTFLLSALIFYNFLMRIFKNQNLAFFGVLLLEISAWGFPHMMIQYWPTSLTVIQCVTIFFLLYVRLQNFLKLERPTNEIILSNLFFSHVIIILIFIGALLTHSLIAVIFLLSFLFLYLIYFLKDYRRGIDFILLFALMGIFLIFYNLGLISEQFWFLNLSNIPWYVYIAAGVGGAVLIWRLKRSILFTTGRFKLVIKGKKSSYYKTIEEKILLPISISIIIFLLGLFFIANILLFDLNISVIFLGFEVLLLVIYGFWGLILFQKKPRGKPLIFWGYGLALIFGGAFILDVLVNEAKISGRIFLLLSPVISLGFVSYIYKVIKLKSIRTHKVKFFVLSVVIFSFFGQFIVELIDVDRSEYNLKEREVSAVRWLSRYSDNKNLIITEFGWDYIFMYYDYPFDDPNKEFRGRDIHYFRSNMTYLYHPDNHTNEKGVNLLQEIKKEHGTDVYIILDDTYLSLKGWQSHGRLSEKELEEYYNLDYLNKICSTKSENGEVVPCYWVI